MATKITRIQVRRDTLANWDANNQVILSDGEIGYEIDYYRFKIGQGGKTWEELPYFTGMAAGGGTYPLDDVLGAGNLAPEKDMQVGGISLSYEMETDGSGIVKHGGVISDLLPAKNFRKRQADGTIASVPITDKISLGNEDNRFSELYLDPDSLHLGKSKLSYKSPPSVTAQISVTEVDEFGRVQDFCLQTSLGVALPGEGYYEIEGIPTEHPLGLQGDGRGLRVNIGNGVDANGDPESGVDDDGRIRFEVQNINGVNLPVPSHMSVKDMGVGYVEGEVLNVKLVGQFVSTVEQYDTNGTTLIDQVSAVATQESLINLTTQSVNLAAIESDLITTSDSRALPPTDTVYNQSTMNSWTIEAATYLERSKLRIKDVPFVGNPGDTYFDEQQPEYFYYGNPSGSNVDLYSYVVINCGAGTVPSTSHWKGLEGKVLVGGEVLYFKQGISNPIDDGEWVIVSGPGAQLEETDPVFMAHPASSFEYQPASMDDLVKGKIGQLTYRVTQDLNTPVPTDSLEIDATVKLDVMFTHRWNNIDRLL